MPSRCWSYPVLWRPALPILTAGTLGGRYTVRMETVAVPSPTRLPRFRRASEPPAFRLTDDDVLIVRHIARHRFLRSTHIAALIGRSLDRTNDRLAKLFHAGYLDRPRAQLDYYPTSGSAPIAYALADRGARLLADRYGLLFSNIEWSRKNREAGRPFIEHQLGVTDFHLALQLAARERPDLRVIHADELSAAFSAPPAQGRNAFSLKAKVSQRGLTRERSVVPDLVFGLALPNASRRYFMVEIDRGTMPVVRRNPSQTSFEQKMRAYLSAYGSRQHEQRFGWQSFRVLVVTTDDHRTRSMMEALRTLRVPHSPAASLFLFATAEQLRTSDPLAHAWRDGTGRDVHLI